MNKKTVAIIIAAVVVVIGIACCGIGLAVTLSGNTNKNLGISKTYTPGASQPASSGAAKPADATKPVGPATTFGDGTYHVGEDIAVGVFVTTVPSDAFGCTWSRDKDLSGSANSIIDVGFLNANAHGQVQIKAGEYFTTSGGCTWVKK